MENISISVVHLIWMPYGEKMFTAFVDSYQSFSAGYQHSLVLLFNGVTNETETNDYHTYIQEANIHYQSFYLGKGQDLEAYRWVADQLKTDYILFVNSYSRFLADNWLLKYVQIVNNDVGIIGASGSWQSYYSAVFANNSWQWTKSFTVKQNTTKYKLMLKALFLWRIYFKPFPNPHIRTNAFLIKRNLFLNIRYQNPVTKLDAYRIESGKNSITQQIMQAGLKVILIDKFGNSFEPDLWNKSKIFWKDDQMNLLIADNQTELYTISDRKNKNLLERIAWGSN